MSEIDYDGPITMIRLEVGLDVPVATTHEDVEALLNSSQDFFTLPSITGSEIGFSKRQVVMWSPAEIKRPSGIEVPQNKLLVPGSMG